MEDGITRLSGADLVSVSTDGAPEGEVVGINADTLGGYAADAYVKKTDAMVVTKNYSVVGGVDEPTNPTKNMIWVQTENTIGKVYFSGIEPGSVNDNDIWIYTGDGSSVAFDAIKIGDDTMNTVYPLYAKQYISGAWVDKTAKSYQGGEWVEWIKYLYDAGDECTDITGGWGSKTFFGGFDVKKNTDNIYLEAIETASGGGGAIFTKNKIALTGDRLILTYSSTRINPTYTILFVSTGISGSEYVAQIALGKTGNNATVELDISGLSGEYYVGVQVYTSGGNTNVTVHRLIMR